MVHTRKAKCISTVSNPTANKKISLKSLKATEIPKRYFTCFKRRDEEILLHVSVSAVFVQLHVSHVSSENDQN